MKKILTIALCTLLFAACGEKNKPAVFDPSTPLYVNVVNGKNMRVKESDNPNHLTPHEIVERAKGFEFLGYDDGGHRFFDVNGPESKDLVNNRFVLVGDNVIRDGKLYPYWFKARDFRVVDKDGNILAYTSNKAMDDVYKVCQELFDKGDYDGVHKAFFAAWEATPITTEEWNKLKEQGLQ